MNRRATDNGDRRGVALLAAMAAGGGVWLALRDDEQPPAATGVTTAPTPTPSPPQPSTRR